MEMVDITLPSCNESLFFRTKFVVSNKPLKCSHFHGGKLIEPENFIKSKSLFLFLFVCEYKTFLH